MASSSSPLSPIDLSPEPDLHPLYPTIIHIADLLSSNSGLAPAQRQQLVTHSMARACVFADLTVIQYLLHDQQAQAFVDLSVRDEDGVGLVSLAIHGFGAESDRDVEREECVRLLIAQGADLAADKAGWTPLHHAALLSPPTLISHLMTHGCSPFAVTRRNLTPLDIVTAHSVLPGREDVALLLEEAMRGEGWTGGKMEARRRLFEERRRRREKRRAVRDTVGRALGVHSRWWGDQSDEFSSSDDDSGDEEVDEDVYTPPPDYSSMLVFSPPSLPQIFESLITNFQPSFRDSQPANTLYMLARFACLTCDHTWLEDLIIGATDAIEESFFERADDVTCLVFWLRNTTIWLHLLRCDNSINEACEMLGSFELIEEVINSVFVFIIRFAERRIDQLLDAALLEYSPLASEFDSIKFESEWSFLRSFQGKKKAAPSASLRPPPAPPSPITPTSPAGSISASTSRGFSSLKQTFSRARAGSAATPIQAIFGDAPPPTSPADITSFLTALHTMLTLSDVNPALTTQLWSQVMYWTSCEMFNRILTRKKFLCRSRAIQISMNLGEMEDWVGRMGLPPGVQSHFNPVRDLLNWLQCLSSITDFANLVATIQTLPHINPLQMRRAVREYKYEVSEGRMTEECVQYLTQLQKDWERHRVKLGVEALRKEQRDTDHDSVSSFQTDSAQNSRPASSAALSIASTRSSESSTGQHGIDLLFEKGQERSVWEPVKPPQVLGELLDSRHMLPLVFPSDPRMLSALPGKLIFADDKPPRTPVPSVTADGRSESRASETSRGTVGPMPWRSRDRALREVGVGTLQWVDGIRSAARWGRMTMDAGTDVDEEEMENGKENGNGEAEEGELTVVTQITPLTRKPSGRTKGRPSQGGETEADETEITPVEERHHDHS